MAVKLSHVNFESADVLPESVALDCVHGGLGEAQEALHQVVCELGESLDDPEKVRALHSMLRCIEHRLAALFDEAEAGIHAAMERRNS